MWRITKQIFLGTNKDARDNGMLNEAGITHIVNCAEELPCYYMENFTYLPLYLSDPDAYFKMRIYFLCRFIDLAQRKGKVLIHCNGGISRSPACVLAYLCHCGYSLFEAVGVLKQRGQTRPNIVFIKQLADYLGTSMSDNQAYEILNILGGAD